MSLLFFESNLGLSSRPKSDRGSKDRHRWSTSPTVPKIPSNLVKSSPPPSKFDALNTEVLIYDRQKLLEFLNERELNLFKTRDEYEEQFANFFCLAKRFHNEKLNNLKLTFKNQILKQQIYFETELLELSKEFIRDYECTADMTTGKTAASQTSRRLFSSKKTTTKADKFEKEKQLVKLCKSDMKKLLDYMREALINSSDTLMEAYETCHILKTLETIENNFQKQNSHMKCTTSNLVRHNNNNNKNLNDEEEDEDEELTHLNRQLSDEQSLFNKYKEEMDELMHTLDDIELQHLQRKDQLTSKTKFFNKLKKKFKFIEVKYDSLNKQIASLKYESFIYKKLWAEKQHSSSKTASLDCSCLVMSSSSRSSSTSSLSDCACDLISANETTSHGNSSSSSSSSLSNQDMSDHLEYEESEETLSGELPAHHNLSLSDYNRKLALINDLINMHKSKMSNKDLWAMSSESSGHSSEQSSCLLLNNFIKANIKYFNLKDEEKSLLRTGVAAGNATDAADSLFAAHMGSKSLIVLNVKQPGSLDLADCSTDGDRVCVENCNLKADYDISGWYMTRQIDNMSISKYKFPVGSVIAAGKMLKIEAPFGNDQLDYLIAIKNQRASAAGEGLLRIRTRLIAPDGSLKAMHTQEVPQFYQEIFKYANLIKFL